jgi:succinate dehydrogenase hydrophobic anchor subunit
MKVAQFVEKHSLFISLLVLFLIIGVLDIINVDSMVYKWICSLFSPVTNSACTDYYDVPIWQVYLSVALLAALYHVHVELRITNKHLKRS